MNTIKNKIYGILVCMLLIASAFVTVTAQRFETTPPIYQNQGQQHDIITPIDSNILFAEGKDETALSYAYLSTNETGSWQDFKGLLDWSYSRRIQVNHLLVKEDFTNFPLLVKITDAALGSHAQTDGDDFVFYDETNTTKFSHEIESYNSGTGELIAWVKLPFISSTVDTVFYLYYGNPAANDQRNTEDVWSNGYVMVHHMTGATYDVLDDSTSSNYDITTKGDNPTFNDQGKIGKSVGFDGTNDYLRAGIYSLAGSYTTSVWTNYGGTFSADAFAFAGNGTSYRAMTPATMVSTSKKFRSYIVSPSGTASYAESTSLASSTWQYVTSRLDYTEKLLKIFVNGTFQGSKILGSIKNATTGLNIGMSGTNNYWFKGKIDEIRISNVLRSDAWIETEYNTMANGGLLTISSEIAGGAFGGKKYGSPMKLVENDQWQWSNFTWYNPAIPSGSKVGWKITYVDSSSNQISTDILSFNIKINNPPYIPSNPHPEHGAVGVQSTTLLEWTGGDPDSGDTVTYDLYFGTTDPPQLVKTGAESPYNPGTLVNNTKYYWKIIAKDNFGAASQNLTLWNFSTLNNAPLIPSNPNPSDGAERVLVDQDLSWFSKDPDFGDVVTYDVYFGTTDPPVFTTSTASLTFDPGTLQYVTLYYWRINATDTHGATSVGPVWHFTTREENVPPNAPSNPTPTHGQTDVSIATNLNWSCSDPNIGDTLKYDVYFGTTTTPGKVSSNQSSTIFNPPTDLSYNTLYYWQIVAWDSQGASTPGPLWNFTTEIDTYPVLNVSIKGGMGLTITVKNTGTGAATAVNVSLILQGGFGIIFSPKDGKLTETVSEIAPGASVDVKVPVLGFALNKAFTAKAECLESSSTKTGTFHILLFFAVGLK